jgi:hypothetical protein
MLQQRHEKRRVVAEFIKENFSLISRKYQIDAL